MLDEQVLYRHLGGPPPYSQKQKAASVSWAALGLVRLATWLLDEGLRGLIDGGRIAMTDGTPIHKALDALRFLCFRPGHHLTHSNITDALAQTFPKSAATEIRTRTHPV